LEPLSVKSEFVYRVESEYEEKRKEGPTSKVFGVPTWKGAGKANVFAVGRELT
jgi:hypothetical protein